LTSIDSPTDSAVSGSSTSRSAKLSNVAQTVLPIVQAIGDGVPIAGGVIKAASGGALHLLRTKKVSLRCVALTSFPWTYGPQTYKKNKGDLQCLVQRLEQIMHPEMESNTFPCIQTPAQEKYQQMFIGYIGYSLCIRLTDMQLSIRNVKGLLRKVKAIQELSTLEMGSEGAMQDIDGYTKEIDRYLHDYRVISSSAQQI